MGDIAYGDAGAAFSKDFKDQDVFRLAGLKYIAIARHNDGKCEAVRVWQLKDTKSLLKHFQEDKRTQISTGGPVYEKVPDDLAHKSDDPIFGWSGAMWTNFYNDNNGVRIALDGQNEMSDEDVNDDAVQGLGMDYMTNRGHSAKSGSNGIWWHDVSCGDAAWTEKEPNWTRLPNNVGTDRGPRWTELKDTYGDPCPQFAQLAIFVSTASSPTFPCNGQLAK